jgi:hypothetical protein
MHASSNICARPRPIPLLGSPHRCVRRNARRGHSPSVRCLLEWENAGDLVMKAYGVSTHFADKCPGTSTWSELGR